MNKTLTTFTVIALIISSWVFLRQLDLNNRILKLERGNSRAVDVINSNREDIDSLSSKVMDCYWALQEKVG